jgi:hypothetical protein
MSLDFSFKGILKYKIVGFQKANQQCEEYFEASKECPEEYKYVRESWEKSHELRENEIKIDLDLTCPSDYFTGFECIIDCYLENAISGSIKYLIGDMEEPEELKAGSSF